MAIVTEQIVAFFANLGVPATGLSPTIRIRELAGDTLVVTDAAMVEIGDGLYRYDFTAYDTTVNYAIRCDGTASLPDAERYSWAVNEDYEQDVEYAVHDAAATDHVVSGSFGAMVKLIEQILRNRIDTNPATGIITLYDDGGTPLLTGTIWQDIAGTIQYNGNSINRKDRLS